MKNCCFTKFKGSVSNDNLETYGTTRIKITGLASTTSWIRLITISDDEEYAKIIGDGYFMNSEGENIGKTVRVRKYEGGQASDYNIRISAGTYEIEIPKYTLSDIITIDNGNVAATKAKIKFNLDNLKYEDSVGQCLLNGAVVNGNISCFENKTLLKTCNLAWLNSASNATGNIEVFATCTLLEKLYLDNMTLTGDITTLLSLTHLDTLSINSLKGVVVTQEIVDQFTAHGVNVSWS